MMVHGIWATLNSFTALVKVDCWELVVFLVTEVFHEFFPLASFVNQHLAPVVGKLSFCQSSRIFLQTSTDSIFFYPDSMKLHE